MPMLQPRLKAIEIQGFRAFGAEAQSAEINAPIAVFWGPNSKGKTSLAEALEFLLTGRTVKRELLGSRRDEFAGALRHAHLADGTNCYVEVRFECTDGQLHTVRRTLVSDYTKQHECRTTLTIDGSAATEEGLEALGVKFSQPPLRAPVLAQHTLNYLFMVSPTERSTYFKALLEVTDLDGFRSDVEALAGRIAPPANECLVRLRTVRAMPQSLLAFAQNDLSDPDGVEQALSETAEVILRAEGLPVTDGLDQRVAALQARLDERRSAAFPLDLFRRGEASTIARPSDEYWDRVEHFIQERDKVDEETQNLTALFRTILGIPTYADAEDPQDCPVCETPDALTPARIAAIRERVAATGAFASAQSNALGVLRRLQTSLAAARSSTLGTIPRFLVQGRSARQGAGFTTARMRELLGDQFDTLVPAWIGAILPFHRARKSLLREASALDSLLDDAIDNLGALEGTNYIRDAVASCQREERAFALANQAYRVAAAPLHEAIRAVVDVQGETTGWQELIDLAGDLPELRAAISELNVRAAAKEELDAAVREINRGIDSVLDEKFGILSGAVLEWWQRLRGGEPTFFSGIERRGKHTIDFKGGMSPHTDQSDPQIRDVIAVFSDSQLHCLGLALFLARAEHYGTSFVVLDDPVLTSDEDYRVHFRTQVISRLHELGIQLIVLTQHKSTQRDIGTIHEHRGVDQFQIDIPDPAQGSAISKTSDELDAMIAKAAPYTNSDDLSIRRDGGRNLRLALERFCKMLLVRKRREAGDQNAAISDYEGRMLGGNGGLVHEVTPHLTNPADPGKVRTMTSDLNPPSHDDDGVPTRQALKDALGNLRRLRKDYLG